MKYLKPSQFVGKSFVWVFVVMIALLLGPRYWGASAGLSSALSRALYRVAGFLPLMLHVVTGCNFDRMWVATETRFDKPVKYGLLLVALFMLGLMVALGAIPEKMK